MKRLLTAALASTALILASCGSTPDTTGEEGADTPAARELGPLADYLGYGGDFDQEAANAKNMADQKKVEELTAACMKEEGFEYKPAVYDYQQYEDPNAEAYKIAGTLEFAEKYGYGISMQRAAQTAMNSGPAQEYEDPNGAYVEAMSESERSAYYDALYGPGSGAGMAMTSEPAAEVSAAEAEPAESSDAVEETTESSSGDETADPSATEGEAVEETSATEPEMAESMQMPSPEEMGCSGRASAEVYPQSYTEPDSEMNQMWEELNRRTMALEENPELKKATEAWSGCMADAGFPGLTSPMTAQEALNKEMAELHGETFESMGDGGWSISSPEEPVTPDPADLEAFTQKEITQAVANFNCAVGLTELRQKLQFEMEEKFVEEFGPVLDRQKEMENG